MNHSGQLCCRAARVPLPLRALACLQWLQMTNQKLDVQCCMVVLH